MSASNTFLRTLLVELGSMLDESIHALPEMTG